MMGMPERLALSTSTAMPGETGVMISAWERSIMALRELESQILKNRPLSELEQLEHQLRRAIDKQEFERAAKLRDRIRALREQEIC